MKLVIENIDQIKILKVRNWAIDFLYKDTRYLLKGSYEVGEGSYGTLYKKSVDGLGKCELEFVCRNICPEDIGKIFIESRVSNSPTLSQLDIPYFIYKLTEYGFVDSSYTHFVETYQSLNNNLDKISSQLGNIHAEVNRRIIRR